MATGLAFGSGGEAVDGLGEDSGAGCLADSAGPAEKVGLRQSPRVDGILQRVGQIFLADNRFEICRPVFPGRHNVLGIAHDYKISKNS